MTGLSMVRMISHVGVRLMVRLGAKADRPHDCRIKAAACGQFGRLRTVGRSKAWRDVRNYTTACISELHEQHQARLHIARWRHHEPRR